MTIWKRLFGKTEKVVDLVDSQTMTRLRRSLIPLVDGADLAVRQYQLVLSVCGLRQDLEGNFLDAVPLTMIRVEDPNKKFMDAIIQIEHAIVSGKVDILIVKEVVAEALQICANTD